MTKEQIMRVFIADDSAIIRERLAQMLAELPGAVDCIGQASDASEAAKAIRRLKPDAVILDIHMPRGSGIDVLREIKRTMPSTVVLMLTNHPHDQYRRTCTAIGADFFLDKSTEFERIPQILQRLIQNSPTRRNPGLLLAPQAPSLWTYAA
jgi:DNA-binding NarL/FixJ family response regulator